MLKEYLENEVIFTETDLKSKYIDCDCPIMATNESELMKESADILCSNNGSVLNVGFGLGIIDNYIRNFKPKEHHIIEIHPQIYDLAIKDKFNQTSFLHLGNWEDIVNQFVLKNKKFDAIYFDTYTFNRDKKQWAMFGNIVDKILNKGGIFSYFNDNASKIEKIEDILKPLNWEKSIKYIPFSKIKKQTNRKNILISKRPYELIWFKK